MRKGIWAHNVVFALQIQVRHPERIDVFTSNLNCKLVRPPAILCTDVTHYKFVEHKLSVKRQLPHRIHFEIKAEQYVVAAAILLLYSAIEDYGIQVIQSKVIGAIRIVGAENNRLK